MKQEWKDRPGQRGRGNLAGNAGQLSWTTFRKMEMLYMEVMYLGSTHATIHPNSPAKLWACNVQKVHPTNRRQGTIRSYYDVAGGWSARATAAAWLTVTMIEHRATSLLVILFACMYLNFTEVLHQPGSTAGNKKCFIYTESIQTDPYLQT